MRSSCFRPKAASPPSSRRNSPSFQGTSRFSSSAACSRTICSHGSMPALTGLRARRRALQAWTDCCRDAGRARAYVAGVRRYEADQDRHPRLRQDRGRPARALDRRQYRASSSSRRSSRSGQGVDQAFTDWRELIRSVEGSKRSRSPRPPARVTRLRANASSPGCIACSKSRRQPASREINDLACLAEAQQVTPVHDLACAAPSDRRRGGAGARRQAHPVDGDPAGTRTCTNGILASNGSGNRAVSACSTPASTPSRSRPRSSPAACSSSRRTSASRKMRRRPSPPRSTFPARKPTAR